MKIERVTRCPDPDCGSVYIVFMPTPELIHYGKMICGDCGRFLKWVKAPRKAYLTQDDEGYYVVNFGKIFKGQRLVEVAQSDRGRKWLRFIMKSRAPGWVRVLCEAELHDYEVTVHA